jgi:hypothetical protein
MAVEGSGEEYWEDEYNQFIKNIISSGDAYVRFVQEGILSAKEPEMHKHFMRVLKNGDTNRYLMKFKCDGCPHSVTYTKSYVRAMVL